VLIANELNFDWCSFCAIYLANPNVCDSTWVSVYILRRVLLTRFLKFEPRPRTRKKRNRGCGRTRHQAILVGANHLL
jgi:hypothetical protein